MGICRAFQDTSIPNIFVKSSTMTTAGTTSLIGLNTLTSTGSLYITDIIINNGGTAGNVMLGYSTGVAAPTGSAILIQPIYVGVTSTVPMTNFGTPIKIAVSNNLLVTAGTCSTLTITVLGYMAQ